MEPTIAKGDNVVVDFGAYSKEKPKRWDIAAYSGSNDRLFIHRIVGLPGENLVINPDGIYINGTKLPLPDYLSHVSYVPAEKLLDEGAKPPYTEYKIPNDSYFLLGDNGKRSYDSRMAGPVPGSRIKGKAKIAER